MHQARFETFFSSHLNPKHITFYQLEVKRLEGFLETLVLSLETLCKQDSPVKTHGEATCYSRTSTGSERRRGKPRLDIRDDVKHKKQTWRPLLLFIPLRLGLSEMNSVYNEPFKVRECHLIVYFVQLY